MDSHSAHPGAMQPGPSWANSFKPHSSSSYPQRSSQGQAKESFPSSQLETESKGFDGYDKQESIWYSMCRYNVGGPYTLGRGRRVEVLAPGDEPIHRRLYLSEYEGGYCDKEMEMRQRRIQLIEYEKMIEMEENEDVEVEESEIVTPSSQDPLRRLSISIPSSNHSNDNNTLSTVKCHIYSPIEKENIVPQLDPPPYHGESVDTIPLPPPHDTVSPKKDTVPIPPPHDTVSPKKDTVPIPPTHDTVSSKKDTVPIPPPHDTVSPKKDTVPIPPPHDTVSPKKDTVPICVTPSNSPLQESIDTVLSPPPWGTIPPPNSPIDSPESTVPLPVPPLNEVKCTVTTDTGPVPPPHRIRTISHPPPIPMRRRKKSMNREKKEKKLNDKTTVVQQSTLNMLEQFMDDLKKEPWDDGYPCIESDKKIKKRKWKKSLIVDCDDLMKNNEDMEDGRFMLSISVKKEEPDDYDYDMKTLSINKKKKKKKTMIRPPSSSHGHHPRPQGHHQPLKVYKVVQDPFLTKTKVLIKRYNGICNPPCPQLDCLQSPCDPRSRFRRPEPPKTLHIPRFVMDDQYTGMPLKREVSIFLLNDNVNKAFLEKMTDKLEPEEIFVPYHPTTQKHMGMAFILFRKCSSAISFCEANNGKSVMGSEIQCVIDPFGGRLAEKYLEEAEIPLPPLRYLQGMSIQHLKMRRDEVLGKKDEIVTLVVPSNMDDYPSHDRSLSPMDTSNSPPEYQDLPPPLPPRDYPIYDTLPPRDPYSIDNPSSSSSHIIIPPPPPSSSTTLIPSPPPPYSKIPPTNHSTYSPRSSSQKRSTEPRRDKRRHESSSSSSSDGESRSSLRRDRNDGGGGMAKKKKEEEYVRVKRYVSSERDGGKRIVKEVRTVTYKRTTEQRTTVEKESPDSFDEEMRRREQRSSSKGSKWNGEKKPKGSEDLRWSSASSDSEETTRRKKKGRERDHSREDAPPPPPDVSCTPSSSCSSSTRRGGFNEAPLFDPSQPPPLIIPPVGLISLPPGAPPPPPPSKISGLAPPPLLPGGFIPPPSLFGLNTPASWAAMGAAAATIPPIIPPPSTPSMMTPGVETPVQTHFTSPTKAKVTLKLLDDSSSISSPSIHKTSSGSSMRQPTVELLGGYTPSDSGSTPSTMGTPCDTKKMSSVKTNLDDRLSVLFGLKKTKKEENTIKHVSSAPSISSISSCHTPLPSIINVSSSRMDIDDDDDMDLASSPSSTSSNHQIWNGGIMETEKERHERLRRDMEDSATQTTQAIIDQVVHILSDVIYKDLSKRLDKAAYEQVEEWHKNKRVEAEQKKKDQILATMTAKMQSNATAPVTPKKDPMEAMLEEKLKSPDGGRSLSNIFKMKTFKMTKKEASRDGTPSSQLDDYRPQSPSKSRSYSSSSSSSDDDDSDGGRRRKMSTTSTSSSSSSHSNNSHRIVKKVKRRSDIRNIDGSSVDSTASSSTSSSESSSDEDDDERDNKQSRDGSEEVDVVSMYDDEVTNDMDKKRAPLSVISSSSSSQLDVSKPTVGEHLAAQLKKAEEGQGIYRMENKTNNSLLSQIDQSRPLGVASINRISPSKPKKVKSDKEPKVAPQLQLPTFGQVKPRSKVFKRRTVAEEDFIFNSFMAGMDPEDEMYTKRALDKLQENGQRPFGYDKLVEFEPRTRAYTPLELQKPTKVGRLDLYYDDEDLAGVVPHQSGCARTEGFYRLTHKQKIRIMRRPEGFETKTEVNERDDVITRHQVQATKEQRSMNRRLMTMAESNPNSEFFKVNQLKYRKKMIKFARSRIHGWGLYALEPIAPDDMIVEYVGQKIRPIVSDVREKHYERRGIGSSYLFRIDEDEVIDATRQGNFARFINHSCQPNCYAKVVTVDGDKRIVIYSKSLIQKGDEITYDYKFPIEEDKIDCLCGAPNCRGTLN